MGDLREAEDNSKSERFERLYAQNFDRVAAYLLARTDRETAADALASTFELVWRRLGDVPEEPLPWLLGVARRVLANAIRSTTRQAALVTRMTETASESSVDGAHDACGASPAPQAIVVAQLVGGSYSDPTVTGPSAPWKVIEAKTPVSAAI